MRALEKGAWLPRHSAINPKAIQLNGLMYLMEPESSILQDAIIPDMIAKRGVEVPD
jgi:hypothetical protein